MVRFAERLQLSEPKQLIIAMMWLDVIGYLRWVYLTIETTHAA
jgi:hypothetical protein